MAKIPDGSAFGNALPQLSTMQPRAGNTSAGFDALARLGQTGVEVAKKIDANQRAVNVAKASSQAERDLITWLDDSAADDDYDTQDDRYSKHVEQVKKKHSQTLKDDPRALNVFNEQFKDHEFKVGRKVTARALQGKIGRQQDETDTTLNNLSSIAANHLIKGENDEFTNVLSRANTTIDLAEEAGVLTQEEAGARKAAVKKDISLSEVQNDLATDPQSIITKMGEDGYSGLDGQDRIAWTNRARAEVERQDLKRKTLQKQQDTELVSDTILAFESGMFVSTDELIAASSSAERLGATKSEDLAVARATSEYILLPKASRETFKPNVTGVANAELLGAMDKADARIDSEIKKDGYSFAVQQNLIENVELDLQDPATFEARVKQSEFLESHYGQPVSPLTAEEASMLVRGLDLMSPTDKTQLAMTLGDAPAVWKQLDAKNAGLFAMTGAIGDPSIMENVFKGQELIKSGLSSTISKADYLPEFDDIVGSVYVGKDRRDMLSASMAYYAATADNPDFDSSDFEDAVQAVSGGIAKINGNKIELPRGVDEDDFDDFIDEFSPTSVEVFGGVWGMKNEEAAELIQKSALVSVGANQYNVRLDDGSRLFSATGDKPLVISFDAELLEADQTAVNTRRAIIDAEVMAIKVPGGRR